MAPDRQQLTAPGAPGVRSAVLVGLAVFLPVLTWVLVSGHSALGTPAANGEFARTALRALTLVLALALPVALSWSASGAGWAAALYGPLTALLIPLPLLEVLWLTGDAGPLLFLRPLAGLALFTVALSGVFRGLALALRSTAALALAHTAVITVTTGAVWALSKDWLPWLGL